jgi:hypothetical protein
MWIAVVGLLMGMTMSSCTCQKAVAPPPTTDPQAFKERDGGLPKKSPEKQAAAATPTPQVQQQVAEQPPAELPDDFPSDVPVYAGAKVEQVQDLPNNAHNVIFRTSGPVNEVTRFYHEQLSKKGFNVTQQFERPNHAFMTYRKGSLLANITIAEDSRSPGQQVIAIMYEEEQPLPFDEF